MVRHLFKMIWNKKKQNMLMISEMLVSFLVLFAVFTLLVYNYKNYRTPMGIQYENVWLVTYNTDQFPAASDSITQYYDVLRKMLISMPMIKDVSLSTANIPFAQNTSQGGVKVNKVLTDHINWYRVENSYFNVLRMEQQDGRWFNNADVAGKTIPVVINQKLRERLFGNGNAIGQLLGDRADLVRMRVIGVVENVKAKGDYADPGYALYQRMDTGSYKSAYSMLIRVDPAASATFEGKLYHALTGYMKNSSIEIEHLSDKRTTANYFYLIPMIILVIVATFLITNVALGLFGILWYNINKRRGEIGLRRAVGASGKSVYGQLVGEALVLATFSISVGVFFAMQFPLLRVFDVAPAVYIEAMVLSVAFIYLLVTVCSIYPGKQAAQIYPAVALHED